MAEPPYDADNPIMRDDTITEEKEFLTDAWAREAASFITSHRDQPFLLYLAYNVPHSPVQALSDMDFIHFDRHEMPGSYQFVNNAVVGSRNFCGGKTGPTVTIENLRFEEPPLQLFGMKIKQGGKYSEGRGNINGITFRNWTMPSAPHVKSLIDGNGTETGVIENLVLESIVIGSTKLTSANADEFITRSNKANAWKYYTRQGKGLSVYSKPQNQW